MTETPCLVYRLLLKISQRFRNVTVTLGLTLNLEKAAQLSSS